MAAVKASNVFSQVFVFVFWAENLNHLSEFGFDKKNLMGSEISHNFQIRKYCYF